MTSRDIPVRRTQVDEIALWLAVAVAFTPALLALAQRWASAEYYQHGFLVPVVSIATAHPRIRALGPSRRCAPALLGLALAVAVYAVGKLAGEVTLEGLALVGAITAMVGYRWGGEGVRRLAFPLAFLLFMVPLPEVWVNPVVVALQTFASAAAVSVLHALGVSVLRDGNVMQLASGEALFVAEACSGITSLLSLIPIGVLLARFTQQGAWRRALLVVAVIPAALLGNAVRVVATVLAADAYGAARVTEGPLHEFAGLLTSAFAVVLVIGLGAVLARGSGTTARAATSA